MNEYYIISRQTKAIMNFFSPYYRAKIIEENGVYNSAHTIEEILDNNCTIHGADLQGRRKSVQQILAVISKLPLPVIPDLSVFMFPTASIKSKDCIWLAYHQVQDFEQQGKQTYIRFFDGTGIYVNASASTIDSQMKRTSQLIIYFNWRNLFGFGKNKR